MSETRRGERELDCGALRDVLGFHVTLAAIVTLDLFERHVGQPLGLRKAEYSMLMLLQANGPTPPKRLARALSLSAPQLTMLLDGLQQQAWIGRQPNPHDGRSQLITLTREGQALARRAATASKAMQNELARSLSAAEHAMLIELLAKVASHRHGQAQVAESPLA